MRVTAPSSWPYRDWVSLRLPYSVKLGTERKSLTHYTKGTQSPLSRLPLFVCIRFQALFHSPPGVLFAFPSRYWSLSVDDEYLALEDGPPIFRQGFSCPALLLVRLVPSLCFRIRGYHPLSPDFPFRSANTTTITHRLFPFRSPLLWESRLISVHIVTGKQIGRAHV